MILRNSTLATGFEIGDNSDLYRTTDGGNVWYVNLTGVKAVAFYDQARGMAGNLDITTDGGVTWKSSTLQPPTGVTITSMEFNAAGDLFVSGDGFLYEYPDAIAVFPQSRAGNANESRATAVVLRQNVPNPFNPATTISFVLPSAEMVQLKIYDILGREVRTLADRVMTAGLHSVRFDGGDLASGVYFYRLTTSSMTITRKMLLLK